MILIAHEIPFQIYISSKRGENKTFTSITFEDKFLTPDEDVSKGLQERLNNSDGRIRRDCKWNRSSAELDVDFDCVRWR